MKLSQVKQYVEGVLKGWFTNKSTLDKLGTSADNTLTFNGSEITASGGNSSVEDFENREVLEQLGVNATGQLTYNGVAVDTDTGTIFSPTTAAVLNKFSEDLDGNVAYNGDTLQKDFINDAVLEKLGEDADGDVTYDGTKINSWEACYAKKVELLDSPITFDWNTTTGTWSDQTATSGGWQLNNPGSFTLKDKVEKYAYLIITCNTGDPSWNADYTGVLNTDVGQTIQWVTNSWGDGDNGTMCTVYGDTLQIDYIKTEITAATWRHIIKSVVGVQFDNAPDATETAHSHDNKATLDLITEPTTGTLAFRGNPINTGCYLKDLWTGSAIWYATNNGVTVNSLFNLTESAIDYDALVFTLNFDNWQTTITIFGTDPSVDGYGAQALWGWSLACMNYKITSTGDLQVMSTQCETWTQFELIKIQGIKFGR